MGFSSSLIALDGIYSNTNWPVSEIVNGISSPAIKTEVIPPALEAPTLIVSPN
jgi:hypothetical protein